jgi:hypothetical protein
MKHYPFLLLLLSGCDLFGSVRSSGKPVGEAYGGSSELRVLDIESPLRAERKLPILSTPEVLAAYVPSHASGDLMVGDHWIFLRLRESSWLVERLRDPDPPTSGDAAPQSMKPLRELDWRKAVIPHRN